MFVGDGNNVARSLAVACAKFEMKFILAAPAGYALSEKFIASLPAGAECSLCSDPIEAVSSADVIYTDTWISMGQEEEKAKRLKDFDGFQINSDLLASAPAEAIVLHCLPAYRGYEISDEAFEAHAGPIFQQSQNRLNFQRTLLAVLMGERGIG